MAPSDADDDGSLAETNSPPGDGGSEAARPPSDDRRPDGGRVRLGRRFGGTFDPEELRRRNPVGVAMDVLYLLTTGFFAVLALQGFWPAVIAAVPLGLLLYFGWSSSKAFLVAQLIAIGLSVAAEETGVLPL